MRGDENMKWILVLVVMTGSGQKMHEPTQMDWWNCRMTEMRTSAHWTGHYNGNRIVGALCLRERELVLSCKNARTCA